MNVFILVLGTRGDLELFLGLGRELQRRGHAVTLGSSVFFEERVQSAGVGWLQVGQGTQADLTALLQATTGLPEQRARVEAYFKGWVRPQFLASMPEVKRAAGAAHYFVNNLKTVWKRGDSVIPGANVTYEPPGRVENLAKHMPRRIDHAGALLQLVALNKSLVDPSDLWGSEYLFTGFWEQEPGAVGLSPELRDFVESGSPPVTLTMGSMVMFDAERLRTRFVEALARSGRRGVVVGGWSCLAARSSLRSGQLFFTQEAPYDWLFARSDSVLHHGGCGTVAAALRAGIPQLLFPLIPSQLHFASILLEAGVAVEAFDLRDLTVEDLTEAIDRAALPAHRDPAQLWRQRINAQQGLQRAGDCIEAHARQVLG